MSCFDSFTRTECSAEQNAMVKAESDQVWLLTPVIVLSSCLQGENNTLPTHILEFYVGPVLNEAFGHLRVLPSAADMESDISTARKHSPTLVYSVYLEA